MILCVTLNKLLNLLHLLVSSLCNADNGFPSHRAVSVKSNDSMIPRQLDAMDTINYHQFCYVKEAWNCWMTLPETLPRVCNVCHNFHQHALHSSLFFSSANFSPNPRKSLLGRTRCRLKFFRCVLMQVKRGSSPNLFPPWNILKGHIYTEKGPNNSSHC